MRKDDTTWNHQNIIIYFNVLNHFANGLNQITVMFNLFSHLTVLKRVNNIVYTKSVQKIGKYKSFPDSFNVQMLNIIIHYWYPSWALKSCLPIHNIGNIYAILRIPIHVVQKLSKFREGEFHCKRRCKSLKRFVHLITQSHI